jgi:site-specific recombinase XerD
VIFRRVRRGGHIQDTQMTAQGIWEVVQQYSPVPNLAPHDLRRTFAKLSDKGGAPLAQIQKSLGHDSIDTTARYIGTTLDLQNAPSDFIKFDLSK